MTPDLAALIEPLLAIAREAGRHILEIYATAFTVNEKADRSPLTEADLTSHRVIADRLSELTPNIPVISEEAPARRLAERGQWEWLWLVDPLDGTREFVKRSGQFSINIALIHRQVAVLGVIYVPVSGVGYSAYQTGGALKHCPDRPPRPIRTHKLNNRVIRVTTSSRSYRGHLVQAYLGRLGEHDYRSVGGALKSCLIAEGEVDLYPRFGPSGEWDTAAAQVIVEEAGGGLTDMRMRPLRYNARPTLINPDFFVFGDRDRDWSQYLPSLHD